MLNCSSSGCGKRHINWNNFQMDTKVDFVFDTVLAYSDALERCMADGGCDPKSDAFFKKYLLTVNLTDPYTKAAIRFDCRGDRFGRYGIYKLKPRTGSNAGKTVYKKVGQWSADTGKAEIYDKGETKSGSGPAAAANSSVNRCQPKCIEKLEYEDVIDGVSG